MLLQVPGLLTRTMPAIVIPRNTSSDNIRPDRPFLFTSPAASISLHLKMNLLRSPLLFTILVNVRRENYHGSSLVSMTLLRTQKVVLPQRHRDTEKTIFEIL